MALFNIGMEVRVFIVNYISILEQYLNDSEHRKCSLANIYLFKIDNINIRERWKI